jgi:CRP/FNR family transcriptional regulator, anaerobic regulatory protein
MSAPKTATPSEHADTAKNTPHDHYCGTCAARAYSVCQAMDDDHMHVIEHLSKRGTIPHGQTFVTEGDEAVTFFNITAGTAKIYKLLGDGRRQIIGFLGMGDFIGVTPGSTYAFTAEAVTDLKVCSFSRTRMEEVFAEHPPMRKKLLDMASNELAEAQEQMLLLGRKTAKERIASFLLGRLKRSIRLGGSRNSLELPMSRHDIADYLGLTTETVSRCFTQMRNAELIKLEGTSIVKMPDLQGLQSLANGD